MCLHKYLHLGGRILGRNIIWINTFEDNLDKISLALKNKGYSQSEIETTINLIKKYKTASLLTGDEKLETLEKLAKSSINSLPKSSKVELLDKAPTDGLVSFSWPVAKCKIDNAVIEYIQPAKFKNYEPLLAENIAFKLGKVNEKDNNSILNFVNEYGLLGLGVLNNNLISENIFHFQREVRTIKRLIKTLKLLQENQDIIDTSFEYTETEGHYSKIKVGDFTLRTLFLPDNKQLTKQTKISLVKYSLVNEIVRKLSGQGVYLSAIVYEKSGHVSTAYGAKNLLGAIYLQLYLMITKRRSHRRCIECDCDFILRRSDNKFCSQKCRKRYLQREYRKKQPKSKKGGN